MENETRHKISMSALPRKFSVNTKQHVELIWDRKILLRRMRFALAMMCEIQSEVHFEFVNEVQMGELNWQFRGKDKPTDVLSFPPHSGIDYDEQPPIGRARARVRLGEIAVCVGVCLAQARTHRCTPSQEIERMLIHGLVHLKGFDHERSEAAFAVMSALEKALHKQMVACLGEPEFCEIVSPKLSSQKKRRVS